MTTAPGVCLAGEGQAVFSELRASGATVYADVSTLLESQWTGIPTVAAGLASALDAAAPDCVRFFLGDRLVASGAVLDALRRNSGLFLAREITSGHGLTGPLPLLSETGPAARASIGIFPSVKQLRRAFSVECSVFHDLSTLVLPHFHIKGNVDHHMEAMLADIASSDVIVAVSAATAEDLSAYLGVAPERILVSHNGVAWPASYAVDAANALAPAGAEPYVLILGTREPRKNVRLIFEMLSIFPQFLTGHRFVLAGKMGWLEEQHVLPETLEPARRAGRILFTGFVSDAVKYRLLAGARATLYPSLYEGFGLPVLESLSAGTPAAVSWSSAIPEVGGNVCRYFDPLSATDMARATRELLAWREQAGNAIRGLCQAQAARFTWHNAVAKILAAALRMLPSRPEKRGTR